MPEVGDIYKERGGKRVVAVALVHQNTVDVMDMGVARTIALDEFQKMYENLNVEMF